MRNIAKIVLIVFVSMLEVGYADDCREKLYEKYKAHSAEFIKLKNKCKPLLEDVKRLADTYRNTVEFKEYEAIEWQSRMFVYKWGESKEYKEAERVYGRCGYCNMAADAMEEFNKKTREARRPLDIEIGATCELFLGGVYDIDKAFERITRAEYEFKKRISGMSAASKKPPNSCVNYHRCEEGYRTAFEKYMAEHHKAEKAAEKALEPLQIAFRNSQEIKEYVAECRGITFPVDKDMKDFNFKHDWDWTWKNYEERQIISYIQSIIANRP
ncbi:hypothetical protein [Helicobacter macacae]|uniref:Uncharacterized protein n=1 Tax=Helicobacter macacae MIT 99-5501 TaxID=1357400 RepID=V8C7Y4_9HELI|nr:hypothetical protein [Helicobacter macacae]ETD23449.1 hypothetical protein HMPREF2086_01254 [Helicobacter macacae MIT 99-5501]